MTGDLPSRRRLGLLPGPRRGGFTLVELLVTLALSGLVSAVVLQLLVGDLRQVGRLGRWLRERQAGERALELVREELQRAESASLSGMIPAGCGEDRKLALQLRGRDRAGQLRTVTYTTGTAPSSIWRGAVLVRCGPAYGLDGEWSAGTAPAPGEESGGVSRVLIDALPGEAGFTVTPGAPGLLQLVLERQLADGQTIRQEQVALEPPPSEQP